MWMYHEGRVIMNPILYVWVLNKWKCISILLRQLFFPFIIQVISNRKVGHNFILENFIFILEYISLISNNLNFNNPSPLWEMTVEPYTLGVWRGENFSLKAALAKPRKSNACLALCSFGLKLLEIPLESYFVQNLAKRVWNIINNLQG